MVHLLSVGGRQWGRCGRRITGGMAVPGPARTRGPGVFQVPSLNAAPAVRQSPPGAGIGRAIPDQPRRLSEFRAEPVPIRRCKSYVSIESSTWRPGRGGPRGSVRWRRAGLEQGNGPTEERRPGHPGRAECARRFTVSGVEGSRSQWTQQGPDGHVTGHGKAGTPGIASGGSPDISGSPTGWGRRSPWSPQVGRPRKVGRRSGYIRALHPSTEGRGPDNRSAPPPPRDGHPPESRLLPARFTRRSKRVREKDESRSDPRLPRRDHPPHRRPPSYPSPPAF
jgi:hypothetical protein